MPNQAGGRRPPDKAERAGHFPSRLMKNALT